MKNKIKFYFDYGDNTLKKTTLKDEVPPNKYEQTPAKVLRNVSKTFTNHGEPTDYPFYRFDYKRLQLVGQYDNKNHKQSTGTYLKGSMSIDEAEEFFNSLKVYDIGAWAGYEES